MTIRSIVATHGSRIIGMGRAISDRVSDAYIQDVTVHSDYRGRGIGKAIVRKLLERLRGNGTGFTKGWALPGWRDTRRSC